MFIVPGQRKSAIFCILAYESSWKSYEFNAMQFGNVWDRLVTKSSYVDAVIATEINFCDGEWKHTPENGGFGLSNGP